VCILVQYSVTFITVAQAACDHRFEGKYNVSDMDMTLLPTSRVNGCKMTQSTRHLACGGSLMMTLGPDT
jgi:hypothetical protein